MKITIVGAGISGLSLAFALLEKNPALDVTVLEAQNRAGGKVMTDRTDGFMSEAGVNGFLDNKPSTFKLAERLDLPPLRSDDNSRKRFIYVDGKLRLIPLTPPAFFMSGLLSLPGRLRLIGEYFSPRDVHEDESLESFAVRRVGREFFEKLLDPMASGVYAGDPSKLSIRSCFAKVYELERDYGGLIKGFMAMSRDRKKTGQKTEAGPGGVLHSFPDGMSGLINALGKYLGNRVMTGKEVSGVDMKGNIYTVYCKDGSSFGSDRLVIASPAGETANMLSDLSKNIASVLREIPYPPLTVVSLGFDNKKVSGMDLNGFGFLVPGREGRKVLGTLYDSSIFPGRAPEGHVLLRSMVGGARHPRLALMEDEQLFSTVLSELSDIMGLKAEPVFAKTFRWEKAIPQYVIGHHERLRRLDQGVAKHPGLYLTGNAYRGVSLNDCIANSFLLADRIAPDGG
jgi:oxygen-dependent protoporphyrinogen oxidase